MAKKSAMEKIKAGAGLEDPEVAKYIADQAAKQADRMVGYDRVRALVKEHNKGTKK